MDTARAHIGLALAAFGGLALAGCGGGGGGGSSSGGTAPAGNDATPPTFAGLTSAVAVNAVRVTLAWSAAADDTSAAPAITYQVFFSTVPGGQNFAAPVAATAAGATSFDVTDLLPSTTYFFVVRAVDAAGNAEANVVQRQVTMPASAVSFTVNLQGGIFSPTCAVVGCHTGASPQQGLNLSAGQSFAFLVNAPSTEVPSILRVKPGDSANSWIIRKLAGTQTVGVRMPEGGPPLQNADIDNVRSWINAGAPNN